MSRKRYLATLAIVAGVSVVFGMLLASGPLRRESTPAPAVWSPAIAGPPEIPENPAALSFADVAERANPAVVSIENVEIRKSSSRPSHPFDLPFGDPFRFFLPPQDQDRRDDDDERERRLESGGSGFIISGDGYILTNNHVIENASKLTVRTQDGKSYEAEIVGKDAMIDLALIKVESPSSLPTLPLGDSDKLRVGEWVIAIGNPLVYSHTVTVGVVSGKGRQLGDIGGELDRSLSNFIQTDAAINFGNSGGPLLNSRGEVVGINTAITRNYGPYQGLIQGIGFALPINQARSVLDQLKETGRVARGYLGIQITPIRERDMRSFGLPSTDGALVQGVERGLPAEKAGLRHGDAIVSVDDKPIKTTAELIESVSRRRPGETVRLGIIREGSPMSVEVKLSDRAKERLASTRTEPEEKDDEGETSRVGRLGVTVAEIDREMIQQFGLPEEHKRGVVVLSVKPSSNAYEEGLRPGMLITEVNGRRVRNLSDFRREVADLQSGEYVRFYTVFYLRNGEESGRFVVLEVE